MKKPDMIPSSEPGPSVEPGANADAILYGDFSPGSKQTASWPSSDNRWVEKVNLKLAGLPTGAYENFHGWSGVGTEWLAKVEALPQAWISDDATAIDLYVVEMQQEYLELMLDEYSAGSSGFTDFKYGIDIKRRVAGIGPYHAGPNGAFRRILTGETLSAGLDQLAAVETLTTTDGSWKFYHHGTEDDFHYYRELVYVYDGEIIGSVNVEVPDGS